MVADSPAAEEAALYCESGPLPFPSLPRSLPRSLPLSLPPPLPLSLPPFLRILPDVSPFTLSSFRFGLPVSS